MEQELKPCPFCGAAPQWFDRQADDYGERGPDTILACANPSCLLGPKIMRATEGYNWETRQRYPIDPKPEMIAAWNTRAGEE